MRKYLAIAGGAIGNVLLAGAAYAQVTDIPSPIQDIGQEVSPRNILVAVINIALILAGALAVIYLIYSGVIYITAGGDAEKAGKGRTGIINAIIGIIIIALAFGITQYLINTLAPSIPSGQPTL